MSPALSVTIKCVLFAVGSLLGSLVVATLDNAITLNEGIAALSIAWATGLGYAGIGYVTPLEATGKGGGT